MVRYFLGHIMVYDLLHNNNYGRSIQSFFNLAFIPTLFTFLLTIKLSNVQFPKGFFRYIVNKRALWAIAVIGVLTIWISIKCFAFLFFSNQVQEEIMQMHEPYSLLYPRINRMIIQRSRKAIPMIFLMLLNYVGSYPVFEEIFYRRILLETLATRIGWFFGFTPSGLAFVAWHNEFTHIVMGNGGTSWEILQYNISKFLSHLLLQLF